MHALTIQLEWIQLYVFLVKGIEHLYCATSCSGTLVSQCGRTAYRL